nr:odorant receptor 10 [Graphosoma rubrolineatum]
MGIAGRMTALLQDWNQMSDEYSDIMIQKEYRGFLHLFGLYPNVNKVGPFWSIFRALLVGFLLLFHSVGLMVSAVLLYDINYVYFSSALHYVLIVGIAASYVAHFNTNRQFIATFHRKMYFNFYDYHEGTRVEIKDLIDTEEKRKKRFTILPMFAALAAVCILLLAPILDKYGTFNFDIDTPINFNLPLPMVYVFDSSSGGGYLVALTHQLSSAMLCGLVLGTTGYTFIVMATSVSVQMRILIHMIEHIESRAKALFKRKYGELPILSLQELYRDKRFSDCMDICLRKCVEHHNIILRNFSEMNSFYTLPLFTIFIIAAFIIALAMVGSSNWKVLPGNTVASLVLCGAECSFLGTLCSLGQSITDLNEDLRTAIYGIKWYHCNKKFCMNIRILLIKTLKPVIYNPCGLIKISHATYANIINSAYSYYNLASATSS